MATTTYALTCLSPVHVGTGTQFGKFDGAYESGFWYLVDLEKVLAHGADANALARSMSDRNFTWATWLRGKGIIPSDVAAYALPCPQDPDETPVREAMKDICQQPYLPGTSVKGAIRTAVLWQLMSGNTPHSEFAARYLTLCVRAPDLLKEIQYRHAFDRANEHGRIIGQVLRVNDEEARAYQETLYSLLKVDKHKLSEASERNKFQRGLKKLSESRRGLAQPVEDVVLGKDPNHDLLRTLQVSDTGPVGIERLSVGLVWTYTLRGSRLVEKRGQGGEYKAFVEWLTPETTLSLTIHIDEFLFGGVADRSLKFRGAKEQAIRQLAKTCNAYAQALIESEKAFYDKHGPNELSSYYAELERELSALSDGAFLLNVGWGGGWEVKTVGDLIREILGESTFMDLRQRYTLGKNPQSGKFDPTFPKTRRIAYEGGAPMWTLGWVKVTPIPSKENRTTSRYPT